MGKVEILKKKFFLGAKSKGYPLILFSQKVTTLWYYIFPINFFQTELYHVFLKTEQYTEFWKNYDNENYKNFEFEKRSIFGSFWEIYLVN